MEPHIRNFTEIEAFIKKSPQEADGAAREWTYLTQKHPEISYFQSPSQFAVWASDPNHKVDPNLWIGKEIRDAYFYIRELHEEKQIQENGAVDHAGVPSGLLGLPFLAAAFLQRQKTFEDDPQFQKIVEKKKKEWLEKNKGLNDNSKAWIDYRYGSLENPEAQTLYKDAEKAFRNGEDLGEKATEKEKEQRRKKVASYDKERKKVYKNLNDDSAVVMEKWRIEYHTQALIAGEKKKNPKITKEDEEKIVQQVRKHHWEKFVEKHPEKAAAYAAKHEGIKEALARSAQITPPAGGVTTSIPPRWNALTPPPPQTPPILQRPILPSTGLVNTQGRPIGSTPSVTTPTPLKPIVERQPPPFNRSFRFPQQSVPFQTRFPSIQTRFSSSGSRFPTGGTIGRAVNLLRPGNALSSLGGKVARQVGTRALLLLANPVVLSVLFIFIFTFIIAAGIGPAGTGEASPTTPGNTQPTIAPPPNLAKDELVNKIRSDFGIILQGSFTLVAAQQIYQTMHLLSNSSTFISHLNAINNPITISLGQAGPNCGGEVRGSSLIILYNPLGQGGCGLIGLQYTLTHELGHIVDNRTNLRVLFRRNGIIQQDGLLETYPGGNSESESFAEMFSVYATYKNYRFSRLGRTFPEFPSRYPNYYAFARDTIFGGIEF